MATSTWRAKKVARGYITWIQCLLEGVSETLKTENFVNCQASWKVLIIHYGNRRNHVPDTSISQRISRKWIEIINFVNNFFRHQQKLRERDKKVITLKLTIWIAPTILIKWDLWCTYKIKLRSNDYTKLNNFFVEFNFVKGSFWVNSVSFLDRSL